MPVLAVSCCARRISGLAGQAHPTVPPGSAAEPGSPRRIGLRYEEPKCEAEAGLWCPVRPSLPARAWLCGHVLQR